MSIQLQTERKAFHSQSYCSLGGSFLAGLIQTYLVLLTPSILGLAAFISGIWLLDAILRASDEPGIDVESCLRSGIKVLQFFGMAIGVVCFAALFSVLTSGITNPFYGDLLTLVLLGLIGFVLLIAPIAKVPWAALVGLLVAIIVSALVALFTPDWLIALIPFNFTWVLIGIFIVAGITVFISLKWFEDLIKAFAFIIASRPITLILAILGIAQAILILFYPGGLLHFILPLL